MRYPEHIHNELHEAIQKGNIKQINLCLTKNGLYEQEDIFWEEHNQLWPDDRADIR